jgi:hypothetical protein
MEEMVTSGELADALGVPQPDAIEAEEAAPAQQEGPHQSPPMQIET